eukprot:TRINITY_DN749_c0_g2_i6.p1 TRINITY_DN749_c0_g2~~TRINITY_DN749_c0_g2_i6.p1  ORF type:complete len:130 (-),score=55.03 TRINITY_DN749_c0_g2_i6:55-444(-)
MLSKTVREHQIRQEQLREENEKLKKEATESINSLSSNLLDSINGGVATVFLNQRKLEREAIGLNEEAQRFHRQTTRWLTLLDSFNKSLKEIGDIENWATVMEADMKVIATTLERIHSTTTPIQSNNNNE